MGIPENIQNLKNRIEKVTSKIGKTPAEVKLIAVSKTRTVEEIERALENGIDLIGENKVQESEKKIPKLKDKYREFHFVGHLQSNKIKKLMPLKPAMIHSIDKFSTAKKLDKFIKKNNLAKQKILIEVNTSGEKTKFGTKPDQTISLVKQISQLPNLKIMGLMTIGIFSSDEDKIRKCFKQLSSLFTTIKNKNISNVQMQYLSMGMTNDFEIAIEEGANIIRIGTYIFGQRNY